MLWLCIALPQLPLEALRSEDADAPLVVTACEGSARWVVCGNPAAQNARLKPDMNYTVALALCPAVQKLERSAAAETAALERLAAWAYQFSSTVVLGEVPLDFRQARSGALWLEIGGSLKLFGGFRNFIAALERELGHLHYSYQLGIGPTLEGAALLARGGIRVVMPSPTALQLRIRNLSIALLALEPEIAGALHTAGVRTIGLLLELPRDAVIKRFGVQLGNFLDRLIGAAADPRPVFRLPARYNARFDFEFEVKSTEALLFPLRRMLHELAGFLRARDTGVQRFTITFAHRGAASTPIDIGLSLADRDPNRFLTLVRERLEALALPAPTIGLGLAADQFAMPAALQADLAQSALQQSEELAHTIDRLAARLGTQHVHGLQQVADHRPEASWAATPLPNAGRNSQFPERPLWLLQEPKPLQLSVMPQIVAGPERIEGGWWDTGDVQRDYYVVHLSNGSSLWVYQDLGEHGGWYLHGFWS
ncbi:MAG: Y-family DNA polymerase [Steroidobacteraceae bacterium]